MFSYYHDDFDDDHYYDDYDYDYGCEYANDGNSCYYCSLSTPAMSRGSASKKKCRSGTAALALILTH